MTVPGKKEKQPLFVTHPELAKEADGCDPATVTPGSQKKLSWQCSKGHKWQNTLRLCGIKPRRLHDARHTAATLMYPSNIGIETISRALGHSSSAITSRPYVHSAEEPLRSAADALGHFL